MPLAVWPGPAAAWRAGRSRPRPRSTPEDAGRSASGTSDPPPAGARSGSGCRSSRSRGCPRYISVLTFSSSGSAPEQGFSLTRCASTARVASASGQATGTRRESRQRASWRVRPDGMAVDVTRHGSQARDPHGVAKVGGKPWQPGEAVATLLWSTLCHEVPPGPVRPLGGSVSARLEFSCPWIRRIPVRLPSEPQTVGSPRETHLDAGCSPLLADSHGFTARDGQTTAKRGGLRGTSQSKTLDPGTVDCQSACLGVHVRRTAPTAVMPIGTGSGYHMACGRLVLQPPERSPDHGGLGREHIQTA